MSTSTIQPRFLRIDDAASYCSVSVSKFRDWIEKGLMVDGFSPATQGPRRVRLWDRVDIDHAMLAMKEGKQINPWDTDAA